MARSIKDGARRQYTREDKHRAACAYAETANMTMAAERTGIPRTTLNSWLHGDEEFADFIKRHQEVLDPQLICKYTQIVMTGVERILQELPGMSGRDCAWTVGVFHDKRRILMDKPTSIGTAGASVQKQLDELRKALEGGDSKASARSTSKGKQDEVGPVH